MYRDDLLSWQLFLSLYKNGSIQKTAAKMMLALKGKLTFNQSTVSVSKNVDSSYQDVINSLVEMGYDKKNVEIKVSQILDSLKQENGFESKSIKEKEEIIFRRVIIEMA